MAFTTPSKLRQAGIVGMNRRNVEMIAQHNPRHLYPLVDDKLQTKIIVEEAGLAAPKLLGVVKSQGNVRELQEFLADKPAFVMKPAKGSGGKGILVITGRQGDDFVKPSGEVIDLGQVQRHASNTLSGLFSLGGNIDKAMLEELVNFSDVFDGFSFQGVPDIRIIVYKGYPVMAMTRLSTRDSDGKANLHQGAVGVGIDIASGRALKAVQHGQPISHHPDTGKELASFHVPQWHDFVLLASRCFEITTLGYLGVDIVLDKEKGPQILELNARPGLAIQIANGQGLMPRFELIDQQDGTGRPPEERTAFSIKHFAAAEGTPR